MDASSLPPVRFTNLKRMAQSPAHYACAVQKDQTYAMERGSALHALILGGPRVVAYTGKVRRGKEWEAFQADHQDAIIMTESEHGKTFAMAAAVQNNALAMTVLEGQHEAEVSWNYLGRACHSHIDVIGTGGAHVAELKTCSVGQPERFAWNALKMGYHAQLAFYMEAVASSGLGDPREAYVVAVESSAPYVVTTMRLTERALDHGRRLFRLWFERLLVCEKTGDFPGYCQSIVTLDAPEDDPELVFGSSGEIPDATDPRTVPF